MLFIVSSSEYAQPAFFFKRKKHIYEFYIPISALPLFHSAPSFKSSAQSTSVCYPQLEGSKKQPPALQITEGLGTYSYTEARKGGAFRSMASRGRQATGSGKDPTQVVGGPA